MKLSCLLFATTTLVHSANANIFPDQAEVEWVQYGCANVGSLPENANENAMAACFCGLLKDRVRNPSSELTASELSAQAAITCVGGSAGSFPCSNVDLQAHLPLSTFGSPAANDLRGWTDSGGREFALIGLEDGTGFVAEARYEILVAAMKNPNERLSA